MPIQTSVTNVLVPGVAGQLDTALAATHVNGEYAVATGKTIAAGQLVELTSAGFLQPLQTPGASIYGIALYADTKEPNSTLPIGTASTLGQWIAGQYVRVLRKGRAYALWAGSTTAQFNKVVQITASTTTNSQGYATDAAVSGTTGSEIVAGPTGAVRIVRNPTAAANAGIALLELNLPGA